MPRLALRTSGVSRANTRSPAVAAFAAAAEAKTHGTMRVAGALSIDPETSADVRADWRSVCSWVSIAWGVLPAATRMRLIATGECVLRKKADIPRIGGEVRQRFVSSAEAAITLTASAETRNDNATNTD